MNTRYRFRSLVGLLGLLLTLPWSFPVWSDPVTSPIQTLLVPYEATYRLQQGSLTLAHAIFTLQRKSGEEEWTLTSRTEAKGWLTLFRDDRIEEISRFRFDGEQLFPIHYQMRHHTTDQTKTETADFNWVAHRVTGMVDALPFSLPLEPHTYDRLSLQILVRAAAYRQVNPIRIRMLEKNRIKPLRLESSSTLETIDSPAGRFDTLRITQIDSKKPITFWLAPTANYLPIRVEQHRGSLHLKLELESLRSGEAFSAALTREAR